MNPSSSWRSTRIGSALFLSWSAYSLSGCAVESTTQDVVAKNEQDLVGGSLAAPYHFRSTVVVGSQGCTGAKVGPRHYLTAAHCVDTEDGDGVSGLYEPGDQIAIRHGLEMSGVDEVVYHSTIAQTSIHPSWLECGANACGSTLVLSGEHPADIAVVEVVDAFPDIPQARVELGAVAPGTPLVKVGLGCEDGLKGPQSWVRRYKTEYAWALPHADLQHAGSHVHTPFDAESIGASYLITAGHGQGAEFASLCPGDSGGPLYLNDNGDPRVVGVNAYYSFNDGGNISWTDWHTRTSLHSRFNVGAWLQGLGVDTVGGDVHEGEGGITLERWNNISGWAVSDIPTHLAPSTVQEITNFEVPTNAGDNYGVRVRGYLTAPTTGSYRFWIAGDDQASLYLGSNESAATKQQIAYHTGYTEPREWTKYPTQESSDRYLVAGNRYYIEALMKEGSQGDNLAVAWIQPGQQWIDSAQVIPSYQLSPITPSTACSCEKGCNSVKVATAPFAMDGKDDNCYFFTEDEMGYYLLADHLDEVDLNGKAITDGFLNRYRYPATRDGGYYLYLRGQNHLGEVFVGN